MKFGRFLVLCLLVLTTVSSRASLAAPGWYDPAWGYRMKITASSTLAQGGPFRDYSMLVRLGAGQGFVFPHSQAHGEDLLITKDDGVTPLPVEVVTFDAGQGRAELWFKADTLASSRRDFYLYYGNPLASPLPYDGAAWSDNYLSVYHLDDDPGSGLVFDSGPHHHNAYAGLDAQFTSSDTIGGAVGQAWLFNGTTHWIDGDGLASSDSSYTISAWFACWNQFRYGDADFAFSAQTGFWHLSAKRNSTQRVPDAVGNNGYFSWTPNPIDTLLHQYTWCMDGVADTIRFYYDGVEQAPLIHYSSNGKRVYTGLQIGGQVGISSPLYGNTNHFDLMEGIVDEFRVRVGALPSARVASEYRNQKSDLFWTYGGEETQSSVPVQLLAFEASWVNEAANLAWHLGEGSEVGSFRLYRENDMNNHLPISPPIPVLGTEYQFRDVDAPWGGTTYRLEWTDRTGVSSWIGMARLGAHSPFPFALRATRPNPFGSATTISFDLDLPGHTTVRVFDLSGRERARPWTGWLDAGRHEIPWNGTDSALRLLPSGVYILRLETPSGTRARKITKAF